MDILDDPAWAVPPVPHGDTGIAWLRSHVARFSEGVDHERRRAQAVRLLEAVDPQDLRRSGHPVSTLAEALGLRREVAGDVEVVAASYQPHDPVSHEADGAVGRLVAACGGVWDENTAARIGLLIQAYSATRSWIVGNNPPVPSTRRVSTSGDAVVVSLEGRPFGSGRHACPGEAHARALIDGSTQFKQLHHGSEPLLLPNAWDFASAAALTCEGFPALGTTSLGVATSHGLPDAAGASYSETMALARSLVRLPVPVSVDVEGGFGLDPARLATDLTVTGVAGINIEDGRGDHLETVAQQCALIAAIKAAAPELFVNARVDTHWLGMCVPETVARAQAYVDVGADGVFVPNLRDASVISELVGRLDDIPLNVLAQLPLQQLRDLGVRRVSTGSLLFRTAITQAVSAATAYRDGSPGPEALSYEHIERTRRRALGEADD